MVLLKYISRTTFTLFPLNLNLHTYQHLYILHHIYILYYVLFNLTLPKFQEGGSSFWEKVFLFVIGITFHSILIYE